MLSSRQIPGRFLRMFSDIQSTGPGARTSLDFTVRVVVRPRSHWHRPLRRALLHMILSRPEHPSTFIYGDRHALAVMASPLVCILTVRVMHHASDDRMVTTLLGGFFSHLHAPSPQLAPSLPPG